VFFPFSHTTDPKNGEEGKRVFVLSPCFVPDGFALPSRQNASHKDALKNAFKGKDAPVPEEEIEEEQLSVRELTVLWCILFGVIFVVYT